jgi:hypothetical protein
MMVYNKRGGGWSVQSYNGWSVQAYKLVENLVLGRECTAIMKRIWLVFVVIGMVSAYKFDCSEQESRFYIEQKLMR